MLVLDASVLVAAHNLDDPHHDAAAEVCLRRPLSTLDLAVYEVTNVAVIRGTTPGAVSALQARIWTIADDGHLIRVDGELARRAGELAAEHGITSYDAAYVAAAERLGAPLVSCDVRDLVSRGLARLPSDALA